ncbi:MAG: C1 family peptidase [Ferruginibacter sp.]
MPKFFLVLLISLSSFTSFCQYESHSETTKSNVIKQNTVAVDKSVMQVDNNFVIEKFNPVSPVKNQARTGTCWAFSTTSLIESQAIKNNAGVWDLSEMYIVRNMYIEKAKNYVLRQGQAQFSEGGLGHDVIRSLALYGAMPENVYTGMKPGQTLPDHLGLAMVLRNNLDSIISRKLRGEQFNWLPKFIATLDERLGLPPSDFFYAEKNYTPQTFAKEVIKFNAGDYVNLTSFTHHPFYAPFILEVPDNFSNGSYYNLPLSEMIDVVKTAIRNGYTVLWDADVSNKGFQQKQGLAMYVADSFYFKSKFTPGMKEEKWSQESRQQLYENLITQDDHLMHIVGIEKSKEGKTFFIVKNSYGEVGPYKGFIQVSEAYFAINTISVIVPKASINKATQDKLKL